MASSSRAQRSSLRNPFARNEAKFPAPFELSASILGSAVEPVRRSKKRDITRFMLESLEQRQMLTRAVGIDVSHFQGTINWTTVHGAGKNFAYQKATEGVGVTDATLATNMSGGAAAGLLMGVYHIATPSTAANDAVNEANYFIQQAGQYMTAGYLPPALDLVEGSPALSTTALSTWANTFETTVKNATGVDPIIFTNNDYVTNHLNSTVTTHPLWIVRQSTAYGDPTTTGSPPIGVWGTAGKTWTFWQYSATGTVAGVTGSVDLDSYTSTLAALQASVVTPTMTLAGSPSSLNEGSTYTLTRSGSNLALSSGSIWTVNWGDGSTPQIVQGTVSTVTHVYDRGPNTYTISATETENGISHAASNTLGVTVNNVAPVLTAATGVGPATVNTTFRAPLATFSDAGFGLGETFTASIDWGDGTAASTGTVRVTAGSSGHGTQGTIVGQHVYAAAGNYTATVTLTDAGGLSGSASVSLAASTASTGGGTTAGGQVIDTGLTVYTQDPSNGNTIRMGDGALVQPDGKIIVAGKYQDAGGNYVLRRYNTNGTLDTTFGTNGEQQTDLGSGDERLLQLAIQPDATGSGSHILAFGFSTGIGWEGAKLTVARFNSDGTLDTTFGTGVDSQSGNPTGRTVTDLFGHESADALQVLADGSFVVAGASSRIDGEDSGPIKIEHYSADGKTLDSGYGGPSASGIVTDLNTYYPFAPQVEGNGDVLAGGWYFDDNSNIPANIGRTPGWNYYLERYTAGGLPDTTFGSGGKDYISDFKTADFVDKANAVLIQPNGSILVGGEIQGSGNNTWFVIKRFLANGNVDSNFGTNGTLTTDIPANGNWPLNLALQTDGSILAAGPVDGSSPSGTYIVRRYGADGSIDHNYGSGDSLSTGFFGGNGTADAVLLDGSGGFYITGQAGSSAPDGDFALYHLGGAATNSPPVLHAVDDQTVSVGATASVSTSFTDADPTDTHTVTINWGDGSAPALATVTESGGNGTIAASHVYSTINTYTVTISIDDHHGSVATESFTVHVVAAQNHPPTLDPVSDQTTSVANPDHVSATFEDVDVADTHTATIDWGDGSVPSNATVTESNGSGTIVASHTYGAIGQYTVTITVSDNHNATASETFNVTVNNNHPPTIDPIPDQTLRAGGELDVTATFSDPDTGDTHDGSIHWGDEDFDDPSSDPIHDLSESGGSGSFTLRSESDDFKTPGYFTATVTLIDHNGGEATRSFRVDVTAANGENSPPVVSPVANQRINEGANAQIQTSFYDVDENDLHGATIDWGDGSVPALATVVESNGTGTISAVSPPYLDDGVHQATLVVTDSDNASTTVRFSVTVGAPPTGISGNVFVDDHSDQPVQSTPTSTSPVTLSAVAGASADAGMDYYEPENAAIYFDGGTHEFNLIKSDGSISPLADVPMPSYDEVNFATVRSGDRSGFIPGDIFAGNGLDGQIVRVTDGGQKVMDPWVTLPNADSVRGTVYVDRTGEEGGDLVVLTTDGQVWLVDAQGNYAKVGQMPDVSDYREALVTVPNDPRWGPLAGKILLGDESGAIAGATTPVDNLYALDIRQATTDMDRGLFGYAPHKQPLGFIKAYAIQWDDLVTPEGSQPFEDSNFEDLKVIPHDENFFGTNEGGQVFSAPAGNFSSMEGDILASMEYGTTPGWSGLVRLYWDSTDQALHGSPIPDSATGAPGGAWEMVTFAPAGVTTTTGPIATTRVPQPGTTVYLDLRHDGRLDAGDPTTTTDADGNYSFAGIAPGTYAVGEVPLAGWLQVDPTEHEYQVTVTAGDVTAGIDFGNQALTQAPSLPPVFTSSPPKVVLIGQTMRYHLSAVDPNGGSLTYQLLLGTDSATDDTTPITAYLDTSNASDPSLVWTPTNSDFGRFILQVTNSAGLTTIQPFTVRVALPQVTDATAVAISDQEVDVHFTGIPGATRYVVSELEDAGEALGAEEGEAGGTTDVPSNGNGRYFAAVDLDAGFTGTVYVYAVEDITGGREYYSQTPVAVTLLPAKMPPPPSDLRVVTAQSNDSALAITWTVDTGDTTFNVYRGTTPDFPINATSLIASAVPPDTDPEDGSASITDTNVLSGHTYYYRVVAFSDAGTSYPSFAASGTPGVSDDLTLQVIPDTDIIGQQFSGPVATFVDPIAGTHAADYLASIAWGDGTTDIGNVTYDATAGDFVVTDTHSYATAGKYTLTVSILHRPTHRRITGTANAIAALSTITLSGVVLHDPNNDSSTPVTDVSWSGPVATFTSSDPAALSNQTDYANTFSASITWNPGSTTTGTVKYLADGVFEVTGSFTYPATEGAGNAPDSEIKDVLVTLTSNVTNEVETTDSTALVVNPNLGKPEGLKTTALSSGWVEIEWTPNTADEISVSGQEWNDQFVLTRKNPDGTLTLLPGDHSKTGGGLTSGEQGDGVYFDGGLTPGASYSYTVQEITVDGQYSLPSEVTQYSTVKTWALPQQPQSVAAQSIGDSTNEITWNYPQDDNGVPSFDVLRSTSPNGPFKSILPATELVPLGTFNASTKTYTQKYDDETAAAGKTYYYKIQAARAEPADPSGSPHVALSPLSAWASVLTLDAVSPPVPPSDVQGAYAGVGRVNLQWEFNGSTDGLLGFDIYRYAGANATDPAGENFITSGTSPIGSETNVPSQTDEQGNAEYAYTDDGVPAGYNFYRVVAVVNDGFGDEVDSIPSPAVLVNSNSEPTHAPDAPTHLSVSNDLASNGNWLGSVTLTWHDAELNETIFRIYRRDDDTSSAWQLAGAVSASGTSFTDAQLQPNTNYSYFVEAINAANPDVITTPALSQPIATVQTPEVGARPDAPTLFHTFTPPLSTDPNEFDIGLTWTASTTSNVDAYNLYRSKAGDGLFTRIAVIPSAQTSYIDSHLPPGTAYDYRLVAVSDQNSPSTWVECDGASTAAVVRGLTPTAIITTPTTSADEGVSVDWANVASQDNRITSATPVRATIDDLDGDLKSWTLTLTPVSGGGQPIVLASKTADAGPGPITVGSVVDQTDGLLCTLDPSQFPSGNYTLTLNAVAEDPATHVQVNAVPFNVSVSLASNIKLGGLTLPFNDLSFNVPGGEPIAMTRSYDSQQANVLGDFGYGWSLDSNTAKITTSATETDDSKHAIAYTPGDLLYVTLPGGQQYTFQFWPTTNSYKPDPFAGISSDPYFTGYKGPDGGYEPQFLAADGSNATLEVPGDIYSTAPVSLSYHGTALTYSDLDSPYFLQAYGPATLGGNLKLKTADGTTYLINPQTQHLLSATYANGDVVTYGTDGSISETTGDAASNKVYSLSVTRQNGLIHTVQLTCNGINIGRPIAYDYLASDGTTETQDLTSVTDQSQTKTTLHYGDASHPHFLTDITKVIPVTGGTPKTVTLVSAMYNTEGQVTKLTNSLNASGSLATGGLDGTNAAQSSTDPSGGSTQSIYGANGDVIRQIQTEKDANGVILGYVVTCSNYTYLSSDPTKQLANIFTYANSDVVAPGTDTANELGSVTQYQSFFVSGTDLAGLRFSQEPTVILQQSGYHLGNLAQQRSYLGTSADGLQSSYRVTQYSNFVLGKPQMTQQWVEVDDANNPSTVLSKTQETTTTAVYETTKGTPPTATDTNNYNQTDHYAQLGDLISTTDANDVETDFTYADPINGVPFSQIATETRKSSTGADVPVVTNVYYTDSDTVAGALAGKIRYTISGSGAHKQETYYAYDLAGNTVLQYTLKTWTNAAGQSVTGWVGATTDYDQDVTGRVLDTKSGVYVPPTLTTDTAGNALLDTVATDGVPAVNIAPYAAFNGGSPLVTNSTTYKIDGTVDYTTDEYGGQTHSEYDSNGHLLATLYPDGSQTQSVYDASGRIILATDKFVPGQAAPVLATRTVYNTLGQVVATQRVSGVTITIQADPNDPLAYAVTGVTVSGLTNSGLIPSNTADPAHGYWTADTTGAWATNATTPAYFSQTLSYYNAQGQVAETVSPSGLRTGTIYAADGTAEYTGPLLSSVADTGATPWYNALPDSPKPSDYFSTWSQSLPNQVDAQGNLFDRTIQGASASGVGSMTDTYKDDSGRTVETLFDDGSFTQTAYSQGDAPVASIPAPLGWIAATGVASATTLTPPAGLTIPIGGSETVSVAQRKLTDPAVVTYDVYDSAGNLVDVYEPPVKDALNGDAPAVPHWHYDYDASGDETKQTDPKGNVTTFAYDENGQKVSQVLPDKEAQTWAYDAYGNQVLNKVFDQTNGVTNATAAHTTWDVYSTANDGTGGRLLDEYRFAADFTPTSANQSNPDASGFAEKTAYAYDTLGRSSEVDDYTGSTKTAFTQYTYDPTTGQPATITTPGGTVNYVYDAATGLRTETWTGTSHASAQNDVLYGYDNQGRLESVSQVVLNGQTPSAVAGGTRYDARGNALATTDPTTLYTYDAAGNLKTVSDPEGTTTSYSYDDLNRLTDETVTNTTTSEPIFAEHIDIQNNGLRLDEIDTRYNGDGSVFSKTKVQWAYDDDGRLTDETLTVLQGSGTGVPTAYHDHFAYDLSNNRIREEINPSATGNGGDGTSGGQTIRYTYNNDDQLKTETESAYATASTTTQVYQTSYTYDADGNLKTQTRTGTAPETDTYHYDLRNRMTESTSNGTATDYGYDTQGVLASQTTGATATYYLNDPNNPTGYTKAIQTSATLGGTPTTSYVLGLKVEAQSNATNGVLYLLTDGHGSTRAVIHGSGPSAQLGTVLATYDYDAFGKALDFNAATASTTWLFGGDGFYDPSTGWSYQLARWRNGFWFTQSDRNPGNRTDPVSLHRYLYSLADPLAGADPSGFVTLSEGNLIHDAIENIYTSTHPNSYKEAAIPGSLGFLRPDVTDYARGEVVEIKPLSPYGLLTGYPQLMGYLGFLNGFSVTAGKLTVTVPMTPNAVPGRPWVGSTWAVGVQYVPVPNLQSKYVFTVGNAGGVVYYITFPKPQFVFSTALVTATSIATQLGLNMSLILDGSTELALALIQQLNFNLSFSITQATIGSFAVNAERAAVAGLLVTVGASLILNSLAGV